MITEAAAIQKLTLRSDLPRPEERRLFPFLREPQEQALKESLEVQLVGQAFIALVAYGGETRNGRCPRCGPRAYRLRQLSEDWVELEYACDFSQPYEHRNRADQALAVTSRL